MNCAACGTENDAGRKFCMECGAPLARPCPSCGTPNPPQSKFCGECGAALAARARPPQARLEPAGRRRRHRAAARLGPVPRSGLVHDAVGAAATPRTCGRSWSATSRRARTVIERHGGVVEKFIGDAVMAVWGTPVTHEDDAERAVRAALELVDAVAALGRRSGRCRCRPAAACSRARPPRSPGCRQPGHGHRRHGEHGLAAAVGRRAGRGLRRARPPSGRPRARSRSRRSASSR